MEPITDLELCDKWCEECLDFISPQLLREIEFRGLYNIINFLPSNKDEAKVVVRLRLAEAGRYVENDKSVEILHMLKRYKKQLGALDMQNAHEVLPLLKKMIKLTEILLGLKNEKNVQQ
jgi:hypothetical protein